MRFVQFLFFRHALVQMATGAGKTFTAITSAYRLLKYGKMKRILFLVDTKGLGEQAEREFLAYTPNDDPRSFSQIYGVRRLKSSYMPNDVQICISTIQRMYSILKEEELDESAEEALQDGTGSEKTTRRVKKTESFFGTDPDRHPDLYEVGCLHRNRDGIKR